MNLDQLFHDPEFAKKHVQIPEGWFLLDDYDIVLQTDRVMERFWDPMLHENAGFKGSPTGTVTYAKEWAMVYFRLVEFYRIDLTVMSNPAVIIREIVKRHKVKAVGDS